VATKKAPAKKAAAKKPAAKKAAPKKKSASKPKVSNVDRLVAAGVIHPDHLADHNTLVINKLRAAEVLALVNLRKRMGAAAEGKDHLRPNFPV
jgi:pyruvate/2-oxoglutarate dehydrogenase complex dihydrolipoamide acyltransferase (E2) component